MRTILDRDIDDANGLPKEGWHAVEVSACEEKRSQRGEDYYDASLIDATTGKWLCYDVIMLCGRGAGYGIRKLRALGAATRNESGDGWNILSASRLVGVRAFAHLHHAENEWKGEKRMRCEVSAHQGEAGYRTKDDPPEGFTDDIPF